MNASRWTCVILLMASIASAIALVWARHQSRELFHALERSNAEHDEAQIEWGRLQLEQATWSENSRIELIAREQLGLDFPQAEALMVIKE